MNARGTTANPDLDITIQKQVLDLADYEFDRTALPVLPSGISYDDVDSALHRANKETDIGVLDNLQQAAERGDNLSFTVELTVDTTEETFQLQPRLNQLFTAVGGLTPTTTEETSYRTALSTSRPAATSWSVDPKSRKFGWAQSAAM